MAVTALDRALVTGDAGRVAGEGQRRPDPEVPEKARRRTFTDCGAEGASAGVMRYLGRVSGVAAGWPSGYSGVRLASCRGSYGLQAWRRGPDQGAGTASRPDASV